jgi:ribosomal protein S18 acetylase RimI-like enzyme
MPRSGDELARARALTAAIDAAVVDERRSWSRGSVLLTPSLPQVWDANYVTLEGRATPGEAEAIAEETSAIAAAAGVEHAAIVVHDEAVAAGLAAALAGLGFEAIRLVWMMLRDRPDAPTTERVVEVSFGEVEASRREMTLEAFPGNEELADQLHVLDRRLEATIGGRWYGVLGPGGVIARAWLRGAGGVGQVEDVATAPAARGRGLARAVVAAAARASLAAGDELTFVVADADETTPELYRKQGFEPAGITHRFVRRLSGLS